MSTIRNHVQLIENIGQQPSIANLESGRRVAKFSLATNEFYKNTKGEKVQETLWHNIIPLGKTAEIFAGKTKEIGVSGTLKFRSYKNKDGVTQHITEMEAKEILLMGDK